MRPDADKSSNVDLAAHDLAWQASTWIDLIKILYKPGVAGCMVIADTCDGKYFVNTTDYSEFVHRHRASVTASSETALEEGTVFSVERRINLPRQHGICPDDIVICCNNHQEILSPLPLSVHFVTI